MCTILQELEWKRSDYVISTKIFWGGKGVNDKGLSRKHIIEGMKVCSHLQPQPHNPATRQGAQALRSDVWERD